MDDKDRIAAMSPNRTGMAAVVQLVPVDAHIGPCYPIRTINTSFRFRVKRSPSGQSRRLRVSAFSCPKTRTKGRGRGSAATWRSPRQAA